MNPNQPDPAFVEHLEWQVRTALRRRERFARPTSAPLGRVARTAALCLLCGFVGAGAVLGAEELQEDRERGLVVARARLELEMADLRAARAVEELERLEGAAAGGFVSPAELEAGRARAANLARDVARERLDFAEVAASGRPADDDLAAPLVAGQDFVSERLHLELAAREEARERRAAVAARTELLHERGFLPPDELARARAAVAAEERAVEHSRERLDLRARFLRGELEARDLLVREQLARLDADVRDRERELWDRESELSRSRFLVERGYVSSAEVDELESARELLLRELEILRAERQLWIERSGR